MSEVIRRPFGVLMLAAIFLSRSALPGQEIARPFTLDSLGAEQQALPVRCAVGGNRAVIEEVEIDRTTIAVYTRSGSGDWSRADTLWNSGGVSALAIQEASAEAAIGVGSQVRFYVEFVPGDWVYSGAAAGITLPGDERVELIALSGNQMAVVTGPSGLVLNGGNRIRLYARGGTTWFEEASLEIERIDSILGPVRAPIADIGFDGARLAALPGGGDEVVVFAADAGGPGAWGIERRISPPQGEVFGSSMALTGDRLALHSFGPDESGGGGLDVYHANSGGTGNWGRARRLLNLPADIVGVELDASGDTLMATGFALPGLALGNASGEVTLWIYSLAGTAGSWFQEAQFPVGSGNLPAGGRPLSPRTSRLGYADLSGSNAVLGLGAEGGGRSSVWVANFLRRTFELGWYQEDWVSGRGTAEGFSSSLAFAAGSTGSGVLAVGNPQDNHAGSLSGSVLLWEVSVTGRGDGQVVQPAGRLESPDAAPNQGFGSAVAAADVISGLIIGGPSPTQSIVAVAAANDNNTRGAVYVFDEDSPGGYVRVDPGEPLDQTDYFGWSIALTGAGLDGDAYLAVGTPGDDQAAPNAGAVYIFRRNLGGEAAWGLSKKITRPASVGGLLFGTSVAVTSGTSSRLLLVSRPEVGADLGKAVLFPLSGSTVTPSAVFEAPAGAPVDFAESVSISGTVAAVGAEGNGGNPGRVYLFSTLDPAAAPTEVMPGSGQGVTFGTKIAMTKLALTEDRLVVGAPGASGGAGNISCYQLSGSPPSPPVADLLYSRNGATGESLGGAVGAWFLYAAAGAPDSDAFAPGAGRVRIDRAGPYEIWAKSHGLLADAVFAPFLNADADPLSNLHEFVLGSDPWSASSVGRLILEPGTVSAGGAPEPAMVWMPPPAPYFRQWTDFRVERSGDLGDWGLAPHYSEFNLEAPRYFPTGVAERQFFRLAPAYPWFFGQSGRQGRP